MGAKYLIDTNTVIDFSSQKIPGKAVKKLSGIIDSSPQISVINKIELLSLSNVSKPVISFVDAALIIPLDEDVIEKTIELRKKYKIKLPDAVISATALAYNLILVTHNVADFKNIKELKLMDSFSTLLINN